MNVQSYSARERLPDDRLGPPTSPGLLAGLQAAHREVEAALDEMDLIARDAAPDAAQFSAARLRAGQAILAKLQITTKVCSRLISMTSIKAAGEIRELRSRDSDQAKLISDHVRRWTPDVIGNDWQGYCQASREMRDGVRELVLAERKLLYPLLGHRC
jgi:hypothetical protein